METEMFQFINFTILSSSIAIFGVFGNIINLIVLTKQGNKSTVSINLMALALADLCNLVTILWYGVCLSPVVAASSEDIIPSDLAAIAGFPHASFVRIKAWITVLMTAERCLCIALPLKIKRIVTPKRTIAAVCVIYLGCLLVLVPEYMSAYLDWKYLPELNRSLIGIVYYKETMYLESVYHLIISVMILTSFPVIVVLTTVLIVKLRQMSHWRGRSTIKESAPLSIKDKMAIRTVVVISTDFIITLSPAFCLPFLISILPEFSLRGKLSNYAIIFALFTLVFDATNSSFNTVLYLLMNRSYRVTFLQTFCGKGKNKHVTL